MIEYKQEDIPLMKSILKVTPKSHQTIHSIIECCIPEIPILSRSKAFDILVEYLGISEIEKFSDTFAKEYLLLTRMYSGSK